MLTKNDSRINPWALIYHRLCAHIQDPRDELFELEEVTHLLAHDTHNDLELFTQDSQLPLGDFMDSIVMSLSPSNQGNFLTIALGYCNHGVDCRVCDLIFDLEGQFWYLQDGLQGRFTSSRFDGSNDPSNSYTPPLTANQLRRSPFESRTNANPAYIPSLPVESTDSAINPQDGHMPARPAQSEAATFTPKESIRSRTSTVTQKKPTPTASSPAKKNDVQKRWQSKQDRPLYVTKNGMKKPIEAGWGLTNKAPKTTKVNTTDPEQFIKDVKEGRMSVEDIAVTEDGAPLGRTRGRTNATRRDLGGN